MILSWISLAMISQIEFMNYADVVVGMLDLNGWRIESRKKLQPFICHVMLGQAFWHVCRSFCF